jgi:hypothetical protein
MKLLGNEKINVIFKGDQNILWDALITDVALFDSLIEHYSQISFVPFIHDEKIGTPDQNLSYYSDLEDSNYIITEDYSNSSGEATYTNIDTSYGIFYFPALELAQLKDYGINVRAISKKYIDYLEKVDKNFLEKISFAGFSIQSSVDEEVTSSNDLKLFFTDHKEQELFYLFTKSFGKFGIAPKQDQNYLFSSINLGDANIKEVLKTLYFDYLLKGLLEQVYLPESKEEIINRSNNLIDFIESKVTPLTTIADLEIIAFKFITKDLGEKFNLNLSKSSTIFSSPKDFGLNNFFFNILMKETSTFIEAYNQSLNETKIDIQRIRLINDLYNIPFHLNLIDKNNKIERIPLFLDNNKNLFYKRSGESYKQLDEKIIGFIIGKAIPFINELRLYPNAIALPEQGSKYLPAADAFIRILRNYKIDVPECRTIRIGLNFLDNLSLNGNFKLVLPEVLKPFFGNIIDCSEFSLKWRNTATEIYEFLEELKEFKEGQEVKAANFILEKNKLIDVKLLKLLKELLVELEERTVTLSIKKADASAEERQRVQILRFELELLVNFYKQRLLSVANGLFYLNDRPYSISIYLMFGAEFMRSLIKNVTFRGEVV